MLPASESREDDHDDLDDHNYHDDLDNHNDPDMHLDGRLLNHHRPGLLCGSLSSRCSIVFKLVLERTL